MLHVQSLELLETKNSIYNILFTVEDTGIGISTSSVPKLFQTFSQTKASIVRKYGG